MDGKTQEEGHDSSPFLHNEEKTDNLSKGVSGWNLLLLIKEPAADYQHTKKNTLVVICISYWCVFPVVDVMVRNAKGLPDDTHVSAYSSASRDLFDHIFTVISVFANNMEPIK